MLCSRNRDNFSETALLYIDHLNSENLSFSLKQVRFEFETQQIIANQELIASNELLRESMRKNLTQNLKWGNEVEHLKTKLEQERRSVRPAVTCSEKD